MAGLGIPIDNDSLYPTVSSVEPEDFSAPLTLLAQRLEFHDPITGTRRYFTSRRKIADPPAAGTSIGAERRFPG
jgi:tRNA pseudouridine32 synthase/23S rRNA pseudouridine746 synthase